MKKFISIALIAIGLASPVSAFDVDLNRREAFHDMGVYSVGDLAVSVKALIYTGFVCEKDQRLYLYDVPLSPISSNVYYEIQLRPDGTFDLTMKFENDVVPSSIWYNTLVFHECHGATRNVTGTDLFPVNSIDGYTTYSDWLSYMQERFQVDTAF